MTFMPAFKAKGELLARQISADEALAILKAGQAISLERRLKEEPPQDFGQLHGRIRAERGLGCGRLIGVGGLRARRSGGGSTQGRA